MIVLRSLFKWNHPFHSPDSVWSVLLFIISRLHLRPGRTQQTFASHPHERHHSHTTQHASQICKQDISHLESFALWSLPVLRWQTAVANGDRLIRFRYYCRIYCESADCHRARRHINKDTAVTHTHIQKQSYTSSRRWTEKTLFCSTQTAKG